MPSLQHYEPRRISLNGRGLHLLTCNGKIQTFSAWARELGISRGVLQRKLDKGMSLENLCHEYLANYRNCYEYRPSALRTSPIKFKSKKALSVRGLS